MKKVIFVSGASGIVGYGILRSLSQYDSNLLLIGATVHEYSVSPAFCHIFEKAPYTNDKYYWDWLESIIIKHHIQMLIPSIEGDVFAWNEHREFFSDLGVFPLLNGSRLISLCKDKWFFYRELIKHNSANAIETSLEFCASHTFPVILKPRRGYASQGIVVVHSMAELEKYQNEIGTNLMVQQVVGTIDEEYTTSAFFDVNSALCAHMTLRRTLSKQGFTEVAFTAELPGIENVLRELAGIFKPIGPTNFQFRKHGNSLKLLEINPRISSATSIRVAFGYNESRMSVDYFLNGKRPSQPVLKTGWSARYTEDVFFYDSSNI